MISKEALAVEELYQKIKDTNPNNTLPLNVFRAVVEEIYTLSHEPTEVTYEEVQCPGTSRPAIWCKPLSASNKHVILYFHGGGYFAGSPYSYRKMAGNLGKATGNYVLVTDYRLAPEAQYPLQLEDTVSTYKWLLNQGFKPKNITVAGDSAGGNLAIATVLKIKETGFQLPNAVVAFSPLLDLEFTGKSYEFNRDNDKIISHESSLNALKLWLGDHSPKEPLANPFYANLTGYPPLYIAAGSNEVLLDDSVRFADVAARAGVEVKLEVAEGMQHVYVFAAGKAPEADATFQKVSAWLKPKMNL